MNYSGNEIQNLLSENEEVLFILNKKKLSPVYTIGFILYCLFLIFVTFQIFTEKPNELYADWSNSFSSKIYSMIMLIICLFLPVANEYFESVYSAQVIITNKKILYKNLFTFLRYNFLEFNVVNKFQFKINRYGYKVLVIEKTKGFPLLFINVEEYAYKKCGDIYEKDFLDEFENYVNSKMNQEKIFNNEAIDQIKFISKALFIGATVVILFFVLFLYLTP